MQRFTISLDDDLAHQFDDLITAKGYVNRSEAVRDLIRGQLGAATLGTVQEGWCVATVSYVYDHHEHTVTDRVMGLQHDHHDLFITSTHSHLDHAHCLEIAMLRGPADVVRACAEQLVALRGVRHGNIHLVPLSEEPASHTHAAAGHTHGHRHHKPIA